MPGNWKDVATSTVLLVALLAVVAVGFALLGGTVLIPLGGAVVWVAVGLLLFLGVQLLVFRAMGLRSKADEDPGDASPAAGEDEEGDADWRAWRG